MKQGLLALILAAGKGTRFKSDTIKVLHPLMGKPMLKLVVDSILGLEVENVYVVVGYKKEEIIKAGFLKNVGLIVQEEQLGTAHAVLAAKNVLEKEKQKDVLIINGDLPLVQPQTLMPLIDLHKKKGNSLTFLTAELDNPKGFGRVIRTEDGKIKIIEEKEATSSQRKIRESNVGVYIFKVSDLLQVLPRVSNDNKKGEFYLTDVIGIMSEEGKKVSFHKTPQKSEFIGVNDRYELALASDKLRKRKVRLLAEKGVTVCDAYMTWIDLDVKIGRDTVVYPSVVVEGKSVIGNQCMLYPFVHVIDSKIGNNVSILNSSIIEKSRIEDGVQINPFSYIKTDIFLQGGEKKKI